jgi:hypothetical protein
MQGYNTGWKFDKWFATDAVSSGATSTLTLAANGLAVGRPALFLPTSSDSILCNAASIVPIMTHGYNSIRLRFLSSATDPSTDTNFQGIVCWDVYLVESDAEEDQTKTFSQLVPLVCVAANTVYTSTSVTATNFYGRPSVKFCNQVRVVTDPTMTADTNTSQDTTSEAYAAAHMGNALGIDLNNGSSTIDTTGVPSGNIINRRYRFSAYSPGFSSDNTLSSPPGRPGQAAGELYINGLAGAARLLVVPMTAHGNTVINHWSNTTSKGTAGATAAKQVAVMYNLIQ